MSFKKWLSDTTGKEDVFRHTNASKKIRKLLSHWDGQHDYVGPSWDGILKFHRQLIKGTMEAAFESAGWYKYKSSTKAGAKTGDMDGKDWRIILPEFNPVVVINCHSCLNQEVWTLNTTVFNSKEVDRSKLNIVTDDNPELCALMWSLEVAKILETSGYKYPDAVEAFKGRIKDFKPS